MDSQKKIDQQGEKRGGKSPGRPPKVGPNEKKIWSIRGAKLRILRRKLNVKWSILLQNTDWCNLIKNSKGYINRLENGIEKFNDELKDGVIKFFKIPEEWMDDNYCIDNRGNFSESCFNNELKNHANIFKEITNILKVPEQTTFSTPNNILNTINDTFKLCTNIQILMEENNIKTGEIYKNISNNDILNHLSCISETLKKLLDNNLSSSDIQTDTASHIESIPLQYSRGNLNKVIAHINRLITINSNNYDYYVDRGILYMLMGQIENALNDFNLAIEHNCNSLSSAIANKSLILLHYNNIEEVNNNLEIISAIDNNSVAYYTLRGAIYMYNNDYENAYDIYKILSEMCQNDYNYYYVLGILSITLKRYDQAANYFEKAIQIAPIYYRSNFYFYKLLSIQSTGKKIDKNDLILYENSINESPSAIPMYLLKVYCRSDFIDKGINFKIPKNVDGSKILSHQKDEIKNFISEKCKDEPENFSHHFVLGIINLIEKKYAISKIYLLKCISLGFETNEVYIYKGYSNLKMNLIDESNDDFITAKIKSLNDIDYFHKIATAADIIGEYSDAIKYYNKLIELTSNGSFYLYIAKIYFILKQYDKAKEYYYKVINTCDHDYDKSLAYQGLTSIYYIEKNFKKVIKYTKFFENFYSLYAEYGCLRAYAIMITLLNNHYKISKIKMRMKNQNINYSIDIAFFDLKFKESEFPFTTDDNFFITIIYLLKNDYKNANKYYKETIKQDFSKKTVFKDIGVEKELEKMRNQNMSSN